MKTFTATALALSIGLLANTSAMATDVSADSKFDSAIAAYQKLATAVEALRAQARDARMQSAVLTVQARRLDIDADSLLVTLPRETEGMYADMWLGNAEHEVAVNDHIGAVLSFGRALAHIPAVDPRRQRTVEACKKAEAGVNAELRRTVNCLDVESEEFGRTHDKRRAGIEEELRSGN